MKFTAQQLKRSMMKFRLLSGDIDLLASLKVNKYDREYQIWKREPLSIELLNKTMFIQKPACRPLGLYYHLYFINITTITFLFLVLFFFVNKHFFVNNFKRKWGELPYRPDL